MLSRLLIVAVLLLSLTRSLGAQPPLIQVPRDASISGQGTKSPAAARVIGIFPGGGHMYAGETKRGFGYLGGVVGILVVGTMLAVGDCIADVYGAEDCGSDAMATATAVAAVGLWGWSIYDAGLAAKRTNARRARLVSAFVEPRVIAGIERDRPGVQIGLSIR